MHGSNIELPKWKLDSIYAGFDSKDYIADKSRAVANTREFASFLKEPERGDFASFLRAALAKANEVSALIEGLEAYTYARFSVDTRDSLATNEHNQARELVNELEKAFVRFFFLLRSKSTEIESLLESDSEIASYSYWLRHVVEEASHQMPPELEDLAGDLNLAGGEAWGRLQESLSSTMSAVWDKSTGEKKTVVELRNLAEHPDRAIREKAFRLELEAWRSMEIPLAAAINGVKGFSSILNAKRGWRDSLQRSAFQSHIGEESLAALISALEKNLPLFRRYLRAKAGALGIRKCAFFDIFAPISNASSSADSHRSFSWSECQNYIVEQFSGFSPEMGAFAKRAFESGWIDAEPREGKIGGAYCTHFPNQGESRVMCNFNGSFQALTTVAHELGHAYHGDVIKELPPLLRAYPMTLAETASIFAETLIFESALLGTDSETRASLLESRLQDATQVIVDILSRFRFEQELFARRAKAELSPAELCGLMRDAQIATYGEGLDEAELHPYMWAVKGHYYNPDLGFYNFPYAFGLLFGMGLYARYKDEGKGFAQSYRDILLDTGRASAEDVGLRAGFDIRKEGFWQLGIDILGGQIAEFEELVKK